MEWSSLTCLDLEPLSYFTEASPPVSPLFLPTNTGDKRGAGPIVGVCKGLSSLAGTQDVTAKTLLEGGGVREEYPPTPQAPVLGQVQWTWNSTATSGGQRTRGFKGAR